MPTSVNGYHPPRWLRNRHLQTILPSLLRPVRRPAYRRERIETPDGDFLDLDWTFGGHSRVAVVSHGLEGSSRSRYILGLVPRLVRSGWDVVAWNMRGCGGEPNRLLASYHSGKSEDLGTVVEHVRGARGYETVSLIGFSVGGNITLKYLGERGADATRLVQSAVALSVPLDLADAARVLESRGNGMYLARFIQQLKAKIRLKARLHPGRLDIRGLRRISTFAEFDERYTAPLNGYSSAADYWAKASSGPFLPSIRVPTLLLTALDDPFLGPGCIPDDRARANPVLTVETPVHGGHVGFMESLVTYWSEARFVGFLEAEARRSN